MSPKLCLLFFVILALSLTSTQVSAETIHVPDDFETIQAAIDAAANSDTILVAPDEYVENINFIGKAITVASLLLTTGDEDYISSTIINADADGSAVTFVDGEDRDSFLTGFTLTRGSGTEIDIEEFNYSVVVGGAILIFESSPVVENCIITDSDARDFGGGLFLYRSAASINDCFITGNSSGFEAFGDGAGVCCLGGEPTISGCQITENVTFYGGGVYCSESGAVFRDCHIEENIAHCAGGGAFVVGGSLFEDCFFRNNSATGEGRWIEGSWGGGVYGDAEVISCEFCRNFAGVGGGIYTQGQSSISFSLFFENYAETVGECNGSGAAVFADSGSVSIFRCDIIENQSENGGVLQGGEACEEMIVNSSIIWGNSESNFGGIDPVVTYSDVQGGFEGEGNIDADPLFVNPNDGDFHLTANSPCIDAGDPELQEDPDGTRVDMGAFYFDQVNEEYVNPSSSSYDYKFVLEVHPNPFNAHTNLSYSLPIQSPVTIRICDMYGRMIEILVNELHPAGQHSISWNSRNLSSGVYLVRMETAEFNGVLKLTLLR